MISVICTARETVPKPGGRASVPATRVEFSSELDLAGRDARPPNGSHDLSISFLTRAKSRPAGLRGLPEASSTSGTSGEI